MARSKPRENSRYSCSLARTAPQAHTPSDLPPENWAIGKLGLKVLQCTRKDQTNGTKALHRRTNHRSPQGGPGWGFYPRTEPQAWGIGRYDLQMEGQIRRP